MMSTGAPAPTAQAPANPSQGLQVGQTLTPQQVKAMMSGTSPTQPAPAYNPLAPSEIANDVTTGVGNFASQSFDALKKAAGTASTGLQSDITPLASGLAGETDQTINAKNVGQMASAFGHATVGTVSDLAKLVLSPVTAAVGTSVNNIADLTSENKGLQDVATSKPVAGALDVVGHAQQAIQDWATQHPDAYKQLSDIVNVATLAAGGKAAPEDLANTQADISTAKESVTNMAQSAGDSISKGLDSLTPTPQTPEEIAAQHQSSMAKDWTTPAEINKPSYKAVAKVLAKNPEIPATLSKMGLNPSDYIENGNYDTQDAASEIRSAAIKESNQQLRPALQLADNYTKPTPVEDVVKNAMDSVNADSDLTRGQKAASIRQINTEGDAMKEEYPNGLSLTNAHDEKITYSKNSGYSPINDPATNNIATGNRYLSQALAKNVEDNAPDTLPVHEVNQDLGKAFGAADYLDALHTKKAPVTLAQTVARGVAKFGGAAIANHLPFVGGELISDFAGYQIGKYVENALENMSKPGRASFLANLQKYEPESYQSLQKYIESNSQK